MLFEAHHYPEYIHPERALTTGPAEILCPSEPAPEGSILNITRHLTLDNTVMPCIMTQIIFSANNRSNMMHTPP